MVVAPQNYREWQRQNTVFQEMAAFRTRPLDGTDSGFSEKVFTTFASASLFHLLGTQAQFGRLFLGDDERPDRNRLAILSSVYFARRFHSDRKALGQPLTLDDTIYTVIGVLPPNFYLPRSLVTDRQPDVIVPLPDVIQDSKGHLPLFVTARLRPGVSLAQARTEMVEIAARLQRQEKQEVELYRLGSVSIFPFSVENSEPSLNRALYLLQAAVVLVLLIACANLANLTLARNTSRYQETIVRVALGASRSRVLALLLSESLLLTVAGTVCGVLLAEWSIRIIRALKPPDIARPELIALNLPVLAFTAGAAGLTAILFGLGPALVASGSDLASRLKVSGSRGSSAKRLRGQQFLIACEVALALMLLTGAGLMIRSLQQIAWIGVGFDTSHLVALDINLPEKRYPDPYARVRLVRDLIATAQAIPGITDAAVTSDLPLHSVSINAFHIDGRTEPARDAAPVADTANVSPGFFHVIGLQLESGRWLTDADLTPGGIGKSVALVNHAFARKYFPGANPLGHRLLSGDKKESFEIVGVVADYRATGAENEARPEIFRPSLKFTSATLVARSQGPPEPVEHSLIDAARSIAPGLAADKIKTLDEYANGWTSQRKFNTFLLEIFAGLALALAISGIHSVLSTLVASRTREIGIRMAIGASSAAIRGLVVRQSMAPLTVGISTGIGGCVALCRLMQSLLFQVPACDPLTISAAVLVILLTSPAALWLPLRRATTVDCTVALREQ
jgi:predicted permease